MSLAPGLDSAAVQNAKSIELAMFQYANDHDGAYPTGASSTEVFQKLINENYVSDPGLFWLALPGKTKATSRTLKPENVAWDVTASVTNDSPDALPVVFLTGYKITYAPGASAEPLFKTPDGRLPGIAVAYHGHNGLFIRAQDQSVGTVANVVPASFDSGGKKYQQLTPDGPLAP